MVPRDRVATWPCLGAEETPFSNLTINPTSNQSWQGFSTLMYLEVAQEQGQTPSLGGLPASLDPAA